MTKYYCNLCGWDITRKSEQNRCVECGKRVCETCFKPGGFTEQDVYDIMKYISPPEELNEDLHYVLDREDPRANLCVDCLHDKFLVPYIGVFKYHSNNFQGEDQDGI